MTKKKMYWPSDLADLAEHFEGRIEQFYDSGDVIHFELVSEKFTHETPTYYSIQEVIRKWEELYPLIARRRLLVVFPVNQWDHLEALKTHGPIVW